MARNKYPEIREKLVAYKEELATGVEAKDSKLQQLGINGYLAQK